jgi:hypothetical protein
VLAASERVVRPKLALARAVLLAAVIKCLRFIAEDV